MFKATEGIVLPTTITGSLPRPHWYSENLGARNFREAMVDARYREQYLDTVATFIKDQETAGLDILTDGDARFDRDVGGHHWFSYAPQRMAGFAGFDAVTWFAMFAPARTPAAIVEKLHAEIRRALNAPQLRDSFLAAGSEPVSDSRADFAKILRDDIRRYAEIIRAAKIELQ